MSYYGDGRNERSAGQGNVPAKSDLTMMRGGKGPDTYLHAGASKTGWPHDHSTEDAYEAPIYTIAPTRGPLVAAFDQHEWQEDPLEPAPSHVVMPAQTATTTLVDTEYVAEMVLGVATVSLVSRRELGKYFTLADAKEAAEALNNHKGY